MSALLLVWSISAFLSRGKNRLGRQSLGCLRTEGMAASRWEAESPHVLSAGTCMLCIHSGSVCRSQHPDFWLQNPSTTRCFLWSWATSASPPPLCCCCHTWGRPGHSAPGTRCAPVSSELRCRTAGPVQCHLHPQWLSDIAPGRARS